MEIRTARLALRPVTINELESAYAYASDLENTKYMMYLPFASLEETEQAIQKAEREWAKEKPAFREFAIWKDDMHIGGITAYFVEDPVRMELGWVLHRDHWRKGYVTEAAQALMEHARDNWGVRCVFACCDEENIASYRLMEKLGMKLVKSDGTRTNRSTGDKIHTELTYEIWL